MEIACFDPISPTQILKPNAMKLRRHVALGTLVSLSLCASSSAATLFWDGGTVNLTGTGNAASNPAANGTWDSGTIKN